MKKNNFVALTVGIIVVALVVLALWSQRWQRGATIKIGADITLTGGVAYWGQQIQQGLDLAVEEANQTSPDSNKTVQILYQDNKGEASAAVSIFQRFAENPEISAVISILTPTSKPLRPLAEQHRIPLLATVVSATDFAAVNDWTFRDFPSQSQQATALAQYLRQELKITTAVALIVTDDYGRDGEKIFSESFANLGGRLLATEFVDQGAQTIRDQAEKLVRHNPESIFIVVRDATLGMALRQIRETGYKGKLVGVNAFDAPVVWDTAGAAGEGCVFTSAYVDYANNPDAGKFIKSYKSNHNNKDPDWVALYGYTIGRYLIQSAREADGDREKLRAKLSQLNAPSLRGQLHMNKSRDVVSPIGIYIRENGNNKLIRSY